ncbi:hypothetical protein LPJ75_007096 [Coemansia sp. RSA 2598]|nr:hypothetical protein LPJ75_007096 [Coemansia sp. RSA 2598]
MSISKEIAEERTRAVSQAADSSSEDANTAGSDVGDAAESEVRAEDVVPAVEVPAPIAAKDDEAKIEIVPPANNAVSIEEAAKLDKVVSAPIPVEKVPVPAKTVKESPVPVDDKPSVTENANPVVAPVKRAKKPADAAAASATGDSSTLTSAASAKGPRKIKKTKKRAVKKPAAATPVSVVDASAGTF